MDRPVLQALRARSGQIGADLLAGASGAAAGAPQAMGFAIIAGVSPIHGLYTASIATIVGALATSSAFMTVIPTNALVLVVGSTLLQFAGNDPLGHLFTLTVMVGLIQLALGLLRLGDLFRFVSNAVMTGFISGAGLLIILNQLPSLTGAEAPGVGHAFARVLHWLARLPQAEPASALLGLQAILTILLLQRTRYRNLAMLGALALGSLTTYLLDWQQVRLIGDIAPMPAGLPMAVLPVPAYAPELAAAAFALALLASLQSAGLTRMVPQPDGSQASINRDLLGQGLANVAGGLFQGLASGGSLSRTAINISAGARTRLANIASGLFIALALLFIGPLVELIPLPSLAGQLMVAATSLIRPEAVRMVWRVNLAARAAMLVTLLATLLLPLEYSIYIGVGLSLALYLWSSAQNVRLVRLLPTDDGGFRETAPPEQLASHEVVVLSVSGNLYFAAIPLLEKQLPLPDARTRAPVVVLRLRDNLYLGSTGIRMLSAYARALRSHSGRLLLAGVGPAIHDQLQDTDTLASFEPLFLADECLFASTRRALAWASGWLQRSAPSARHERSLTGRD